MNGKNLEKLRKERGITQEDLIDAMEMSRQTISSLQNGRYKPSITLVFKIAHYFNLAIVLSLGAVYLLIQFYAIYWHFRLEKKL
ncbi:helix-turn-helix transcriptional regulator [Enterococcus sp. 669A]|uniref:Helix-turn-helix transcriptional regulator n=1 Tax=Candidatus Enterococcus moelleringii TaxID=2815325 RepID=A0ABS3LG15_9ENTE|nr:helix-turn-helix transcriptional regulator [Enterococcus sp. 669A]MBO1308587.1 helix-turn-helix transcriptional regulator [Enterococcus sp. 669A]